MGKSCLIFTYIIRNHTSKLGVHLYKGIENATSSVIFLFCQEESHWQHNCVCGRTSSSDLFQCFQLVFLEVKDTRNCEDNKWDHNCTPYCGNHNQELGWNGIWLHVSITYCRNGDDCQVYWVIVLSQWRNEFLFLIQEERKLQNPKHICNDHQSSEKQAHDCTFWISRQIALESESHTRVESMLSAELLEIRICVNTVIKHASCHKKHSQKHDC